MQKIRAFRLCLLRERRYALRFTTTSCASNFLILRPIRQRCRLNFCAGTELQRGPSRWTGRRSNLLIDFHTCMPTIQDFRLFVSLNSSPEMQNSKPLAVKYELFVFLRTRHVSKLWLLRQLLQRKEVQTIIPVAGLCRNVSKSICNVWRLISAFIGIDSLVQV